MPARFLPPARDHGGEFRSKLVGGNNEIVAASEGYDSYQRAFAWPTDMLRWVIEAHEWHARMRILEALDAELIGEVTIERMGLIADKIIAALEGQ